MSAMFVIFYGFQSMTQLWDSIFFIENDNDDQGQLMTWNANTSQHKHGYAWTIKVGWIEKNEKKERKIPL